VRNKHKVARGPQNKAVPDRLKVLFLDGVIERRMPFAAARKSGKWHIASIRARQRSASDAFGAKRTLTESRYQKADL
jgi:hypothetical protein